MLLQLVATRLIEGNQLGADRSSFEVANSQQALNDAISMLPRLQYGLDVNVQFSSPSGVTGFEFTQEFAPFDLLDITLAHGWLVDPQDTKSMAALAGTTYNHVVGQARAHVHGVVFPGLQGQGGRGGLENSEDHF